MLAENMEEASVKFMALPVQTSVNPVQPFFITALVSPKKH